MGLLVLAKQKLRYGVPVSTSGFPRPPRPAVLQRQVPGKCCAMERATLSSEKFAYGKMWENSGPDCRLRPEQCRVLGKDRGGPEVECSRKKLRGASLVKIRTR